MREGIVREEGLRLTDVDTRRLRALIDGFRPRDLRDASGVARLERHLDEAQVLPASHIGPDVVTMGSEVRIRDLDTQRLIVFRVVLPRWADASAGRISVLAPLGMAVLGRREGDHVTWESPGGHRRSRLDRILHQPEREGREVA